jgi:uncharacterized membrane protein SpoIIM required for sporulation
MVLESLIGEKNIRQRPYLIFLITFVISVGSIIAAHSVFPSHASVLSVAFITIGLVPILHNILGKEEYEEIMLRKSAATFFARHFNLIMIYVWVFIGIILAFAISYIAAPMDVKEVVFAEQINAFCYISGSENCIEGVPNSISGRAATSAFTACQNPSTKNIAACSFFIFENNAGVLIFIIILSLLYGAGAIFIIAWNASLLGLFFGEMFSIGSHATWLGFLQSMLIGHGPPELFAYIFGALAGTVLSAMISRGNFLRDEVSIILKDVAFLTFIAFFSVLYGALVEGIGILGMGDLHFVLGFIYLLFIIIAIVFYGRKKFIIRSAK